MTKKGFYRIGLAAAILSTLGWVAFVLAGNPSYPGLSGRELFQAWQNDRIGWLMYGWGGVFGALLSIPYFQVFRDALKDKVPASSVATTTAIIGCVLTAYGFFAALVMIYAWVPAALEASPESLPMIGIITEYAADVFEVPWWIGSFMVYCLGVGIIAYYALRTGIGPIWVNIVGIVGGLSGIIWLRYFFRALYAIELIGSLVNILAVTVWAIGLAVALLRAESKSN